MQPDARTHSYTTLLQGKALSPRCRLHVHGRLAALDVQRARRRAGLQTLAAWGPGVATLLGSGLRARHRRAAPRCTCNAGPAKAAAACRRACQRSLPRPLVSGRADLRAFAWRSAAPWRGRPAARGGRCFAPRHTAFAVVCWASAGGRAVLGRRAPCPVAGQKVRRGVGVAVLDGQRGEHGRELPVQVLGVIVAGRRRHQFWGRLLADTLPVHACAPHTPPVSRLSRAPTLQGPVACRARSGHGRTCAVQRRAQQRLTPEERMAHELRQASSARACACARRGQATTFNRPEEPESKSSSHRQGLVRTYPAAWPAPGAAGA
jgi:hypothetical protein